MKDSITLTIINIICFIIIFIISTIIINMLKNLLRKQVKKSSLRYIDRILGGAIGFLKAVAIIFLFFAVVVPFFTIMSKNGALTFAIDHSKFAKDFYYFNFMIPWIKQANNPDNLIKLFSKI